MSIVVPNTYEVAILNLILNSGPLSLRLYSNNYTPDETATLASFTQVAGGGYAAITLAAGGWTPIAGNPSIATFAQQIFSFTGPTTVPSTIYGYYVVDSTNVVRWAERFPGANVPFSPIAGSSIRITPKLECA